MKITFLSFYNQTSIFGAEVFVNNLSQELGKKNTVLVYSSANSAPKNDERLSTKHILRRLFITPQKIQEFIFYLHLLPDLIKNKSDIIIPLNSGWNIPILKLFSIIFRSKLVIIGQSGPGWDDRFNLFWKPDLFICLSKTQLNWAQKATPWRKQHFSVISNGVDIHTFTPNGKKIDLKLQKPIIATVSATRPAKRLEETLKAVSALSKGSFLLLGSGPLDKKINKMGQKLLGENRFLHKSVPHSDVPKYLRSANLFTLVSESSEAFGIAYLEALSTGLPIIATDDELRREMLGSVGVYLKNPQNTDSYKEAILTALKNKNQKLTLARARKYTWKTIASKYQEKLSEIISSNI